MRPPQSGLVQVGLEESVVPFESQAVSQFREARFRVAGFPQLMNADRKKELSPVLTRPPLRNPQTRGEATELHERRSDSQQALSGIEAS